MPKPLATRLQSVHLSARAFAMFSVISILAVPIGEVGMAVSLGDLAGHLGVGVLSTAVTGVVVWAGWNVVRVLGLDRWPRVAVVVALLVIAGAARGWTIYTLMDVGGLPSALELDARVVASVATTLVWMMVLSLFIGVAQDFTLAYRRLERDLVQPGVEVETGARSGATRAALSQAEKSAVMERIERAIAGLPIPEEDNGLSPQRLSRLSQALRHDVLSSVRSESHSLWRMSSVSGPHLKVLPVLAMAVRQLRSSFGFVATVWGLLSLAYLSNAFGPLTALWRVGVGLVVFSVFHLVYRRFLSTWATERSWLNPLYLLTVGIVVAIPNGLADFFLETSPWGVAYVAVAAVLPAAIPVVESALNISSEARTQVLREMLTLVGELERGKRPHALGPSRDQLASYLHNSLQAEIQSIIGVLEYEATHHRRSGTSGIPEQGREALARLRELASRSLEDDFSSFRAQPLDHLDRVIQGWSDLVNLEVTWTVSDQHMRDSRIAIIVQIIEEVASNAVVHGAARALTVEVVAEGKSFAVFVTHDGSAPAAAAAGMGSSWLQRYHVSGGLSQSVEVASQHTRMEFRL